MMNISEVHQICEKEKKRAAIRCWNNPHDNAAKHDAAQAIHAWDGLLTQLYKPNSSLKHSAFCKAKDSAIRIINFISDAEYKEDQIQKIQNLQL